MRRKKSNSSHHRPASAADFSPLRELMARQRRLRQNLLLQAKSNTFDLFNLSHLSSIHELLEVQAELNGVIQRMADDLGMDEVCRHMTAIDKQLVSAKAPASVFNGAKINSYQLALLECYPGRNDLVFDPKDPKSAAYHVFLDHTGDGLFTFLWRTLADRDPNNVTAILKAVDLALSDLQAVKTGLALRFGAASNHGRAASMPSS